MTRFLSLVLAATLITGPTLAGGVSFDMPQLTYPETTAPVIQSTSGAITPAPVKPRN